MVFFTFFLSLALLGDRGYWDLPGNSLLPEGTPVQERTREPPPRRQEVRPPKTETPVSTEPPEKESAPSEPLQDEVDSSPPLNPPTFTEELPDSYSTPTPQVGTPPNVAPQEVLSKIELSEEEKAKLVSRARTILSELKKKPENIALRIELADIYMKLEMYAYARMEYVTVLQKQPENSDVRVQLGFCLLRLNRAQEACQQFSFAIRLAPNNADAYFGMGLALVKMGCHGEAYEVLTKAQELAPGYTDIAIAKANIDLYFRRYRAAYGIYSCLNECNPSTKWVNRMKDIRQRYLPSTEFLFSGSSEDENDLITKIRTTRIMTFSAGDTFTVPWTPYFTIDVTGMWNKQLQANLVTESYNYRVEYSFVTLGGVINPNDNWTIAFSSRVKSGQDVGENIFPFENRTLSENTLLINANAGSQYLFTGVTQDSFIARDFSTNTSYFVRISPLIFATYEWRFAPYSSFGVKGTKEYYRANYDNIKRSASGWLSYRIPTLSSPLVLGTEFEYGTFELVDPDYNSYRWGMEAKGYVRFIQNYLDCQIEAKATVGWAGERDFTNTAEIIAQGLPPPQILKKNYYTFQEFFFEVRKSVGERFDFSGNAFFYYNSNQYKTYAGKIKMRILF